jgi:hypothetical protein
MPARILTTSLRAASVLSLILLPSQIPAQSSQGKADTTKSLIEIRFARRAATPGFQQLMDPESRRVVYVSGENVFTDADFAHVRASTSPDALILDARWTVDAAGRWAEILRGKVGAGNDIALFVDGELVSVLPILVSPDATGTPNVAIAVPVPADRRKRIVDAVAVRWPGGAP